MIGAGDHDRSPGGGSSGTDPVLFPRTHGAQVRIRPATAASGRDCYRLIRGLPDCLVPDEGRFLATLNHTFDGFFAVTRRNDDTVVGYTVLADPDPAGHIRFASWMAPEDRAAGTEAALLTVNYAFAMWPLRKVYVHVTDASPDHLGQALGAIARLEAVLSDYEFFGGQAWDVRILAIYRDDWLRYGGPLVDRLVLRQGVTK